MSSMTITDISTTIDADSPGATTSDRSHADPAPSVLARDEGVHHHFLGHLATTKVRAGETGAMCAVEFVAPRGFGPPLHVHADEDEVMIVLEGEIVFRAAGTETVAAAGATVFLPHGVPHSFQVLSETARFTAITASRVSTPVFADMVATLGTEVDEPTMPMPAEIDPVEVARVNAEHRIEVLGPPPAPLPT
jgi:quercetin dioxygenase-like cupin family protein